MRRASSRVSLVISTAYTDGMISSQPRGPRLLPLRQCLYASLNRDIRLVFRHKKCVAKDDFS